MDVPIERDDGRIAHFEGDGMGPREWMPLRTATFAVACERILGARNAVDVAVNSASARRGHGRGRSPRAGRVC